MKVSLKVKLKTLNGLAVIAGILITGLVSYAGTKNYTYDSLNRLKKVDYGNGKSITYTYDAAGNRLTMNAVTNTSIPTAITLTSFAAKAGNDGSVKLRWETATEINNAGFNIYRARLKDGNYKKINAELIDAKGSETEGASYSFEDTPPASGTYYYKLEDVEYGGATAMHGPVKVRVKAGENEARRR